MSTRGRAAALIGAAALVASAVAGSESAAEKQAEHDFEQAADQTTCRADAESAPTPYGDAFPSSWPFPPQTTVFHTEDRGADGTIVTAVSSAPFEDVLAFLNGPVADAGFEVEKGETEEHDAEAEWAGEGFHGRWAIRESSQCPGETVIQVLSTRS
jgi:hypothetical protein